MKDELIVKKAALLFGGLMAEFDDYRAAEGEEQDVHRDALVERLQGLFQKDLIITLLFAFDILHKIGPKKVEELLEAWNEANPVEEETKA